MSILLRPPALRPSDRNGKAPLSNGTWRASIMPWGCAQGDLPKSAAVRGDPDHGSSVARGWGDPAGEVPRVFSELARQSHLGCRRRSGRQGLPAESSLRRTRRASEIACPTPVPGFKRRSRARVTIQLAAGRGSPLLAARTRRRLAPTRSTQWHASLLATTSRGRGAPDAAHARRPLRVVSCAFQPSFPWQTDPQTPRCPSLRAHLLVAESAPSPGSQPRRSHRATAAPHSSSDYPR